jgi:chromosome segregation ATPase
VNYFKNKSMAAGLLIGTCLSSPIQASSVRNNANDGFEAVTTDRSSLYWSADMAIVEDLPWSDGEAPSLQETPYNSPTTRKTTSNYLSSSDHPCLATLAQLTKERDYALRRAEEAFIIIGSLREQVARLEFRASSAEESHRDLLQKTRMLRDKSRRAENRSTKRTQDLEVLREENTRLFQTKSNLKKRLALALQCKKFINNRFQKQIAHLERALEEQRHKITSQKMLLEQSEEERKQLEEESKKAKSMLSKLAKAYKAQKTAHTQLDAEKKKLSSQINSLRRSLLKKEEDLRSALGRLKKEIHQKDRAIHGLKVDLKESQEKEKILLKRLEQAEQVAKEKEEEILELRQQLLLSQQKSTSIDSLEEVIQTLKSEKTALQKKIVQKEAEILELQNQVQRIQEELLFHTQLTHSLRSDVDSLNQKLITIQKKEAKLRETIEAQELLISELRCQIQKAQESAEEKEDLILSLKDDLHQKEEELLKNRALLQKSNQKVFGLSQILSVRTQKFKETVAFVEHLQKDLEEAKRHSTKLQKQLKRSQDRIQRITSEAHKREADLIGRIERSGQQKARLRSQADAAATDLIELRRLLEATEVEKADLEERLLELERETQTTNGGFSGLLSRMLPSNNRDQGPTR